MKFWQEGMQNASRIILILFLVLLAGLGIFLAANALLHTSPLQRLAGTEAQWIVVVDGPEVLARVMADKDLLTEEQAASLLPGMDRTKVAALLSRLPAGTVLVGYGSSTLAAFLEQDGVCQDFARDALQATLREGLCVLHVGALDVTHFDTKEGSLRSLYGAQLPDIKAPVRALLTQNFPMADVVSAAWSNVMTPEALMARSMAAKKFPVAMTLTTSAQGDIRLQGHILVDAQHPLPQVLQDAMVSRDALQSAPAEGAFAAFVVDKALPGALHDWLTKQFGDDVARMASHVALTLTEQLTPVGIDVATLPTASVALTWPHKGQGSWSAVLTDLDAEDKTAIEKGIKDALTFLYGIEETATTLPDKTRGVLVTASMERIETATESMSGTLMTTYSAEKQPRLVTTMEETSMRFSLPGTMTGAVLRAPEGTTQEIPWQLPVDEQQALMVRLPLRDTERQIYAGLLFLRDRLRFDIALTARS